MRSDADGRDAARPGGERLHPVDHRGIGQGAHAPVTVGLHRPGHQKRVDALGGHLVEGGVGEDAHAGGGGDGVHGLGREDDPVGRCRVADLVPQEREHLRRPGDIEQVHAVEEDDRRRVVRRCSWRLPHDGTGSVGPNGSPAGAPGRHVRICMLDDIADTLWRAIAFHKAAHPAGEPRKAHSPTLRRYSHGYDHPARTQRPRRDARVARRRDADPGRLPEHLRRRRDGTGQAGRPHSTPPPPCWAGPGRPARRSSTSSTTAAPAPRTTSGPRSADTNPPASYRDARPAPPMR